MKYSGEEPYYDPRDGRTYVSKAVADAYRSKLLDWVRVYNTKGPKIPWPLSYGVYSGENARSHPLTTGCRCGRCRYTRKRQKAAAKRRGDVLRAKRAARQAEAAAKEAALPKIAPRGISLGGVT